MSLSFLRAAEEFPDRVALVDRGLVHTYGSFAPAVRGAMDRLARLGVRVRRPGPGPAALFTGSPETGTFAFLHALVEFGLPFAPLHPRLTPTEREEIARACRPAVTLRRPRLLEPLEEGPVRKTESIPDDGRPLAIVFTSGSTGKPKGVVLSRAAFVASARASEANLGWEENDRWGLTMSLAHIGGLSVVTRALLARRAVVRAAPFDATNLARAVQEERITLLSLVPAMVRRLLDLDPPWTPPAHLRAILIGGGAVSERLLAEGNDRGLPLLPTYGLTETCSQVATARPGGAVATAAAPPLPGVEMRVREGRIQVRGPMTMTAYFPEDSCASPYTDDGWLDTGDLGEIDGAGRVTVRGRADDVVSTGGENVSLREVEEALVAYPGIAGAVAFGVEDDTWGVVVAAAVATKGGGDLDRAALDRFLRGRLAPHKRPRRLARIASIPETPSGKPDRGAARRAAERALEPFPG
ncbi:MAG: AMP-binding protein [Candidatus Eisenbacteria bacterium]